MNYRPDSQIRSNKAPNITTMIKDGSKSDADSEIEDQPRKVKVNVRPVSRLTFSQIVQLYTAYVDYVKGMKDYGFKYSERTSLNDISEDTGIKKSTIHYYFSKVFAGKPTYLENLFFCLQKEALIRIQNQKNTFFASQPGKKSCWLDPKSQTSRASSYL